MSGQALGPVGMRDRKEQYYAFVRSQMPVMFKPDGTYQPGTENDPRIPYWAYPAMVSSPDPDERAFANVIYAAAPMWDGWDVFCTSSVAANLVRERERMTPELVTRSEQYLAKFVVRNDGRSPCSGANDYVFHGYNDNMPAMSVRAMILAGDVLGRQDYTDQGLFYLEGLCAHFGRRGLLSEHTSGTYLPVSLAALMDVAECSTHDQAREMALACANRILLNVSGHWHRGTGCIGGVQSRAYTADLTETLTIVNALMWYLTGDPLAINPIEALRDVDAFEGHVHHGANVAFNVAQFCEVMSSDYGLIAPGVREFARAPRRYPYEIYATTDTGQSGLFGGVKAIQTRAFHQPLYGLATQSDTWFNQSGQQETLHAVFARVSEPRTWKDRVAVWHKTIAGEKDQGDVESYHDKEAVEIGHVNDVGHYHVLQKRGSALLLGSVAPAVVGEDVSQLKFSLLFGTFLHMPDEMVESGKWHFLRFGDVYVGVRMSAMVDGQRVVPRRVVKNRYLRLEVPLIEGRTVEVTHELREWCDFGCVFEMAAKDECGSFEAFCRECEACAWEFYHAAYRTSRYLGRHGELQIVDSAVADTVRFMAIDGVVEPRVKLAATGLDPELTRLFPDGRRVQQRRLMYRPEYIGSPFYDLPSHILENDVPRET